MWTQTRSFSSLPLGELKALGYTAEATLGSGTFGLILKAKEAKTQKNVAVKILNISKKKLAQQARLEVEAMEAIGGHQNIVKLVDSVKLENSQFIVMEYCPKGDLLHHAQTKLRFAEDEALHFFRQMVDALEHTHAKGYIHRDVKLENMFLAADGTLKLGDWGFARPWSSTELITNEFPGSIHYVAPEILKCTPYYGPEVDVWSLGVCLFAMVSGAMPFAGSLDRIIESITNAKWPRLKLFSRELIDLLQHLLDPNPDTRYKVSEIKNHPWMTSQFELPLASSFRRIKSATEGKKAVSAPITLRQADSSFELPSRATIVSASETETSKIESMAIKKKNSSIYSRLVASIRRTLSGSKSQIKQNKIKPKKEKKRVKLSLD
eukprot:TRINITY_DN817_c0_g1_i1.p1 TRINITY_DN817_c0_g1~~TRINITY_DN817_c0_g1_i1.p1  ORF type:complete len:411 (-),score=97.01 TRINITY_DN817_c0_g1_i1:103-1239(-)